MKKHLLLNALWITGITLFFILNLINCGKETSEKIDFLLDWKAESYFSGYFIAQEKGFYQKENLNVNILAGKGAETTAKLVGTGKYPLGTCSAPATVIARSKGIPVISIAVLYQETPSVILSLKEKGIREPKDLLGKTLGVRYYDISHQEYKVMMKINNLNTRKVKEVSVGWELQPLLTGQVDALYSYVYSMPVQARLIGKKINIISMSEWGVKDYGSNIIANEEFLKNNPEIVKRFLSASIKGWEYVINHPDETINIFYKLHPETDKKLGLEMLKSTIPLLTNDITNKYGLGYQLKERWENTQEALFDQKVIYKRTETEILFTNEFLR